MKTLGDQAKAFRDSKGWNSTQMGDYVGTSRQNIESLELHGNRIPKYIGKLAIAMGRSVDDMLVEADLAPKELTSKSKPRWREWPLKMVSRERFDALDETEQGFVQAEMLRAIKECEAQHGAKPGKSPGSSPAAGPRKAA